MAETVSDTLFLFMYSLALKENGEEPDIDLLAKVSGMTKIETEFRIMDWESKALKEWHLRKIRERQKKEKASKAGSEESAWKLSTILKALKIRRIAIT